MKRCTNNPDLPHAVLNTTLKPYWGHLPPSPISIKTWDGSRCDEENMERSEKSLDFCCDLRWTNNRYLHYDKESGIDFWNSCKTSILPIDYIVCHHLRERSALSRSCTDHLCALAPFQFQIASASKSITLSLQPVAGKQPHNCTNVMWQKYYYQILEQLLSIKYSWCIYTKISAKLASLYLLISELWCNRKTNIHAVRTSGEKFISSLHCVAKKEKSLS